MTRRDKLFWGLAVFWVLVVVLLSTTVKAGTVGVSWDPSATAQAYRVYMGTTVPGNYDIAPVVDTSSTSVQITGLPDNCTPHFTGVTAYNVAGESGFSEDLAFLPRPQVLGIPTDDGVQQTLVGDNFGPGVTVTVDGAAVTPVSVACQLLVIPFTEGWLAIQLCNGPVCMVYALGPPEAPTNVNIN